MVLPSLFVILKLLASCLCHFISIFAVCSTCQLYDLTFYSNYIALGFLAPGTLWYDWA